MFEKELNKGKFSNCFTCRWLERFEEYSNDFCNSTYFIYYYKCLKKPTVGNLKQFPFKNTKCLLFEKDYLSGIKVIRKFK